MEHHRPETAAAVIFTFAQRTVEGFCRARVQCWLPRETRRGRTGTGSPRIGTLPVWGGEKWSRDRSGRDFALTDRYSDRRGRTEKLLSAIGYPTSRVDIPAIGEATDRRVLLTQPARAWGRRPATEICPRLTALWTRQNRHVSRPLRRAIPRYPPVAAKALIRASEPY